MSYTELKREVYEANMELQRRNLVIYTFGNVSQVDRDKGVVAIKPSGVSYDQMKPEDIVIVDMENNIVEGTMRPSSDTKTHTHLYRAFDSIGGVTHTHSTYATAWAQARQSIPCLGTTHADYVHGEIILNTINFTSTERANDIIEIQTFPQSNDVIGLKDLYLSFAIGDSEINMIKDTITSGEQISGVGYKVTSSYSNGVLTRG